MQFDLNHLPKDPALLRQMILDLLNTVQQQEQRIEKLMHLLQCLQRSQYGRKSEQLPLEQMLFAFAEAMREEGEAKPEAEAVAEPEIVKQDKPEKSPRNGHGRNPLPESLPRQRIEYPLHVDECKCKECGEKLQRMGEEVSRQLEYIPASFIVREHVRIKYACKRCQGNVVISSMPAQPIEKGLPGPGLLAHVLVSKYCDHLPLHRQEAIMQRYGIELSRGTMSDWVRASAQLLQPVYEVMRRQALRSRKINTDDTPVPVQEPGSRKTRQGRLWVYVGDEEHAHTVFDFTPNRKRAGPLKFLNGYRGYLQADAYAGYDELYRGGGVIEVGCWAHARRKFYDAQTSDRERALAALAYIGSLYEVEKRGREEALTAADLRELRQRESKPILEDFQNWLKGQAQAVLPRSPMGEAIGYTLGLWTALTRYLEDGDLEIDNNAAERALRRVALGRKNWLFAGSDEGGRRAAIIYSLMASCQRHGVEPFAYLRDVLARIPSHRQSRIEELLPNQWNPETPHVPVETEHSDG